MGDGKKDKFRRAIDESPLFSLERGTSAYAAERERVIGYIYEYMLAENRDNEEYGYEIMLAASACIDSYDADRGEFFNLVRHSISLKIKSSRGREAFDSSHGGMHISDDVKKAVREFNKLCKSRGYDYIDEADYTRLAESLGLDVEDVLEAARLLAAPVVGDVVTGEDGEEASIFDSLSDGSNAYESVELDNMADEIFAAIESAYTALQERQKPVVADLMTARVLSESPEYINRLKEYKWASSEMTEYYLKHNKVMPQRSIGEKHNRSEASISRTVKDFMERIRANMQQA